MCWHDPSDEQWQVAQLLPAPFSAGLTGGDVDDAIMFEQVLAGVEVRRPGPDRFIWLRRQVPVPSGTNGGRF
jgi:hypothetical protein